MKTLSRLALSVALVVLAAPLRADESIDGGGVPMPERVAAEAASNPAPVTAPERTGPPAYQKDAVSIEAVRRPGGAWGPLAIAADLLVVRPIGFVSLFADGALFAIVSPVAAATQTLGDSTDALSERARDIFTRPLGAL